MKITKTQLKQIIKEELGGSLDASARSMERAEAAALGLDSGNPLDDFVYTVLDRELDLGSKPEAYLADALMDPRALFFDQTIFE